MHYHKRPNSLLLRVRRGFRSGVKIFILLLTVASAGFGLFAAAGEFCNIWWIIITIIVITLYSFIHSLIHGYTDHLPDSIVITGSESRYEVYYETKEICEYFNSKTASYFGNDYVDNGVVESWRLRNPKGFIYLSNEKGQPCAALCLFAIEQSFMEQFKKGRVAELDIESNDILDFDGGRKANSLYLPVIVVDEPHAPIGHRRALVMVWALIEYVKKVYGTRRKRVLYAVPINKASTNLLQRLGFNIVSYAQQRKDKHDMYAFEISAQNISTALDRLGDYSRVCSFKLDETLTVTKESKRRIPDGVG